jgi:L-iditol 2-dehydrogenase
LLGAFHHTPEMIRRAVEILASGALVPDSLISHRMPLEEVGQALALMAKGEALKVLIQT